MINDKMYLGLLYMMGVENMSVEMAYVYRGDEIESIHRGDLIVVNYKGDVIYEVGDGDKVTYLRSAAKPFQAIPMVEQGGIEAFDFNQKDIAIMTSSHGGEERHVKVLKNILNKLGIDFSRLNCGVAKPMYGKAAQGILCNNKKFNQFNNPCSGKHSCMLALCKLKDYNIENYTLLNHPVQQDMIKVVSEMTEIDRKDIKIAIDGCGVPVFGMSIKNMAIGYAKLANPSLIKSEARRKAIQSITSAMITEPYYVAGTGRLDTALMDITKGRILAKLGAEAVYCISIMDKGVGITLKIEDGSYRAIDPIIIELLRRLKYINKDEFELLKNRWEIKLKNHRKEIIGKIKAIY